jgi:hypothetical protein
MITSPAPAPRLELADVIRRFAPNLGGLPVSQRRVLNDLAVCRTAALGGHVEICDHCQHQHVAYNSCRNRHCPRCQASACARWMEDRAAELLPVEYFHVVFTLPEQFNSLCLSHPAVLYGLLFDAVSKTLLEVAANPKHLGARTGFLAILHTWGQNLSLHPHLHCVVPGGGLGADGTRWISCRPGFFLPVRILSRVFRGKFLAGLGQAHAAGRLGDWPRSALEELITSSLRHDWVVYAKPPFGGPEQVLKYLSGYTHRIALSNRRLLEMDDQTVTFAFKDYAHGGRQRRLTLRGEEFLRRFLMHVVPRGFVRIRHYGLLANRNRNDNLQLCRRLLAASSPDLPSSPANPLASVADREAKARLCPVCGRGHMIKGPRLSRRPDLLLLKWRCDSS